MSEFNARGQRVEASFCMQMLRKLLLCVTILPHLALPLASTEKNGLCDVRENCYGDLLIQSLLLSATKRSPDISVLGPWASR